MHVMMRKYISGGRYDGTEWPPEGVPFEVADWEGEDLVYHGHAVRVPSPAPAPVLPPPPALPSPPEQAAPAVVEEARAPVQDEPPAPTPSDPKAAWVAYAVSQGASSQEAESLTKNQLQSAYGGRLLS